MERTDKELVRLTKRGDEGAFRELVERYQRKIFSVALGMVGNPDDAMDITQEAFISAYRSIKSFRGDSSFYTWICRIAINLGIDMKRRNARSFSADESEIEALEHASGSADPDQGNPREAYFQSERREAIAKAIEQLPPAQRATVMLREVDGMSYEEIATTLKISKGTVMSRLHYARKRLQDQLAPYL